jgi:hypothetical protein
MQLDRSIASSILIGLVAGTLGTIAYVAGRRRLWRFRSRPLARIFLELGILFGASAVILGVIFFADSLLARARASYNPQILVLSMFVPMGIARIIAERLARRIVACFKAIQPHSDNRQNVRYTTPVE